MNAEVAYRRFGGAVSLVGVSGSFLAALGAALAIGNGHYILGGLGLIINAVTGGLVIGEFRDWRRYRRMYFNLKRQRDAMPLSYPELQQIYQHFALEAIAEFNAAGRIQPRLLLVALDPSRRDRVRLAVRAPASALESLSDGSAYRNVQAFAANFLCDLSATRQAMAAEGMVLPDLVALVDEACITCEKPERRNVVAVFLYAREGIFMGCSPIHNPPPRRAVYDPRLFAIRPDQLIPAANA